MAVTRKDVERIAQALAAAHMAGSYESAEEHARQVGEAWEKLGLPPAEKADPPAA